MKNYFDDDEKYFNEEEKNKNKTENSNNKDYKEVEEEEDPLESFMKNLSNENNHSTSQKKEIIYTEDILPENLDNYNETNIEKTNIETIELDETKEKLFEYKNIQPLTPFDFNTIELEEVNKNFLDYNSNKPSLSTKECIEFRKFNNIKVKGSFIPNIIKNFNDIVIDEEIISKLKEMKIKEPTPIQSQAIPIAFAGRDLIAISKTGSGKTIAFIIPMIMHVLDQRPVEQREGPIALVITPTRELAIQVNKEINKFCKAFGIKYLTNYF